MIPWILPYFGIVIVGFILGFGPWIQRGRGIIRIVSVWLAIPLGLIAGLVVLLTLAFYQAEPPGLTDLAKQFSSKRADLETILKMANEDKQFSRIAPSFVDLARGGRYMADDLGSQLSKAHWDEYRRIYKRNGIKLGIQRDAAGDAFIMVDSIGLLNRGHATGYLFCDPSTSVDTDRFWPCLLHQQDGQRGFDPEKHIEAYSFHKLDDRWYAYDEGPS